MDINSDGHIDILSGSYSRMEGSMAGLFQVLHGQAKGGFKKAVVLKGTDGKPLVIPKSTEGEHGDMESICTRPTAVDWDGDGDLDLVVGNMTGRFYLFTGEGGGKFAPKPAPIRADGKPLQIKGHHGDPFLIDWDRDGDLDLLSGSDLGGVQWAENTAGPKQAPKLKPFEFLIPAEKETVHECRPNDVKAPAGSTRVWAADINGDKKLDLLVGDTISLISPADNLTDAEFVKRYDKWKKDMRKLTRDDTAPPDEQSMEEMQKRVQKLYEEREEFMSEDRTGFVWVYLQK